MRNQSLKVQAPALETYGLRAHLWGLFSLAALLTFSSCAHDSRADNTTPIPIVDTHIHLYHADRLPGLPWPDKNDQALYRSFLANDYNQVIGNNKLAGAIVVEASPRVSDNDWVLFHTKEYPNNYIGLIGALEFDQETFKDDLDRLCQDKRFLGLRIGTQYLDQPGDPNYLKNPVVLANIKRLSDAGKTLDVLLLKLEIEDVIYIAKNHPQMKIVINNIDRVISAGKDTGRNPGIKAAASFPNVYCKVTSLIHQCTILPEQKYKEYYKAELEHVLEVFGEDRLIYGSNWPCIIKDGEFSDHFKEIDDYFSPRGRVALEKLYYQNAERAYGFRLK